MPRGRPQQVVVVVSSIFGHLDDDLMSGFVAGSGIKIMLCRRDLVV